MNPNHNNPGDARRLDLLAGFVDCELGPADRALVEAWIASDPTANSELELQSRLSRQNNEFWQKASPPMPAVDDWNRVLAGIHQQLTPATPAPRNQKGTRRKWASMLAAIAAMFLLAVGVKFWPAGDPGTSDPLSTNNALVLVHSDDVTVIDIVGDDSSLVIGRSPLTGSLDLVTFGDTELWAISTELNETPSKPNVAPGDRKIWVNSSDKLTPVP